MPVIQKSQNKKITMDETHDKHILKSYDCSIDTTDNAVNNSCLVSKKLYTSEVQRNEKSFIQQRVERLYGPGALAQGFYSPRKTKYIESTVLYERSTNLHNQYSYSTTQKKFTNNKTVYNKSNIEETSEYKNNSEDLPVLRHLRPEFRAQLTIISPKKLLSKVCLETSPVLVNGNSKENLNDSEKCVTEKHSKEINEIKTNGVDTELIDNNETMAKVINSVINMKIPPEESDIQKKETNDILPVEEKMICNNITATISENTEKDGNYFLNLLKTEQNRLLIMADEAEKELDLLSNSDVPDEVFGYLRSASGKARLLVSQKMKQFEGLCKNNLNQTSDEKFPTTNEDLHGFWDMIKLQIDHVDSLFNEIEYMKINNWKKQTPDAYKTSSGSKLTKRPTNTKSSSVSSTIKSGSPGGSNLKRPTSSAASQKREAQRKQLLELKRRNKMAISTNHQQPNSNSVEIFINENCS